MRQLWVPSGVEEYQLQSAVANICPNFDDDDSGVDNDYDRRSDHRSNAISRCKYNICVPILMLMVVVLMVIMTEEVTTGLIQSPGANICLNFGPLPALVPPLYGQVLVNLSKEQFILHPAPVTWCCLASLSF